MLEQSIDLWYAYDHGSICCVTTNGCLRADGTGIMGRGVALQARDRWPDVERRLGDFIKAHGVHVCFLRERLLAFPTKHYPNHAADPSLIRQGLSELQAMYGQMNWAGSRVYLPRPGCGHGRLSWEREARPLCAGMPDWLVVVHKPALRQAQGKLSAQKRGHKL